MLMLYELNPQRESFPGRISPELRARHCQHRAAAPRAKSSSPGVNTEPQVYEICKEQKKSS